MSLSKATIFQNTAIFQNFGDTNIYHKYKKIIKKETPISVKMIRNYFESETRNKWVDWNGNTSIEKSSSVFSFFTFEDASEYAEKFRIQGTKFKIDEYPAILIGGDKGGFLILSSSLWVGDLNMSEITCDTLWGIEKDFYKVFRNNTQAYYLRNVRFKNYHPSGFLQSYDSVPAKPKMKWTSKINREINVENYINFYQMIKALICKGGSSLSNEMPDWSEIHPKYKKYDDDKDYYYEAKFLIESKRYGRKVKPSKSLNKDRINYWYDILDI
ncbi:hypothetical protein NX722_10210 [Endozoicomonas gorgoniicola]|uniref:Uncharacterized protein n=1 Tax=Endozoicomonas gorgoniicola TaxID=1234144 RepID=A0ABT3MUH1_9GAMM|nr:hypothetical protein [Endozoicomonas gorgoniicola]MCW7553007.1 hypothetical protein [Endozoicomonas gorgoniicola]